MCGFVGFSSDKDVSDEFHFALNRLRHRGPDGHADCVMKIYDGREIRLGHNRLAIIDLSATAGQPMVSSDGRYAIVFNGEIYNFREVRAELSASGVVFKTQSDTEVVLQTCINYGPAGVSKLSGMFAFACVDLLEGTIIFSRDRFGKKPLYYFHDRDILAFASELVALLEFKDIRSRVALDPVAIHQVLQYGFIAGERSAFRGIKKFPPATTGLFSLRTNEFQYLRRYWSLCSITEQPQLVHSDEIESRLDDAVRGRLVADVPIAMFLSGGVDSSLVYSQALRYVPEMPAYTISFPGYEADETDYAKEIGAVLGGHVQPVVMTKDDVDCTARRMLDILDEPIADAAMIPLMFLADNVSGHHKVALSGDGGDEIFGGYIKYQLQELIEHIPASLRPLLAVSLLSMTNENFQRLGSGMRRSFAQRQFLFGSGGFLPEELDKFLKTAYDKESLSTDFAIAMECFTDQPFRLSMFLDTLFQLPDWYLYKTDRATMAHGLELRSPLLDHELAELAFAMPLRAHRSFPFGNKKLLKRLLGCRVPRHLVYRRKLGFAVNLSSLLSSEWAMDILRSNVGSSFFNLSDLNNKLARLNSLQRFKMLVVKYYLLRFGVR